MDFDKVTDVIDDMIKQVITGEDINKKRLGLTEIFESIESFVVKDHPFFLKLFYDKFGFQYFIFIGTISRFKVECMAYQDLNGSWSVPVKRIREFTCETCDTRETHETRETCCVPLISQGFVYDFRSYPMIRIVLPVEKTSKGYWVHFLFQGTGKVRAVCDDVILTDNAKSPVFVNKSVKKLKLIVCDMEGVETVFRDCMEFN